MSSDERELRAALENTQAALRRERETAKQLGQTTAELETRLRETKQRERDLQSQLQSLPRPAPELIYVSQPETPQPPKDESGWWFPVGFLGLMLIAVALKILWEISDSPPWETGPSLVTVLPWAISGALLLVVSIFGAVRSFRR